MNFNKEELQTVLLRQVKSAIEEKSQEIAASVIRDLLKTMIETKEINEKVLYEIRLSKEDLNETKRILDKQEQDLDEREKIIYEKERLLDERSKSLDSLERSLKFRESNLCERENNTQSNSTKIEYVIANEIVSEETTKIDFNIMKISQLITYCRENGIQGYSKCNKSELIELIENSLSKSYKQ